MVAGEDGAPSGGELGRSEERFRLLVESVVDYAIFMLDPDGIIRSWNVGAERLKGYRQDEIVGRHYSTFYTPESRAAGLPDQLLRTAREQGRVEHSGWRVRKDGSRFWANVVITALYDHGTHTGFAKVTRDMTDAHLAEEARRRALEEREQDVTRLRELDQWRVEFIGSIVHDLQSPVTAIAGFAQLLLAPEDGDDEATRHQFLEQIASNARSLQELIDNLRTHTRLTERRVELAREPVDVAPFLHRLVEDMAPVLDDRPVTIEADDVEVSADPRALERALRNLLSNAVRHTPPGTSIHVRVRAREDAVHVEVEDDGPGIPPELMDGVFERYRSGATGGTGLGLSIAKQLVELHGGAISAHRGAAGGAAIRFTLPHDVTHSGAPDSP